MAHRTDTYLMGPALPTAKAVSLGSVTDLEAWLGSTSNTLSGVATIQTLYRHVGFFRRCVDTRARYIAAVPWEILRGEDPVWNSTDGDQAPDGMAFLDGFDGLRFQQAVSLALCGESYHRKLSNGLEPTGFQYLNPTTVEPKIGADGLDYFERTIKGHIYRYEVETVLHTWGFDPWVEIGPGSPEGDGARVNAAALKAMGEFVERYMRRGALKNVVLSVPRGTAEPERNRLKDLWRKIGGGSKNAGEAMVVEAESVGVSVVGDGLSDLDNEPLTNTEKRSVADAFGVPASLVLPGAANYATAQQDVMNFLEAVVVPEARKLARAWNAQVFAPLGLTLRMQPDRMEAYQTAQLEQAKAVRELVGRPILSVEEGRELLGMDRDVDGELYTAPAPAFGGSPAGGPAGDRAAEASPDGTAKTLAVLGSVTDDDFAATIRGLLA